MDLNDLKTPLVYDVDKTRPNFTRKKKISNDIKKKNDENKMTLKPSRWSNYEDFHFLKALKLFGKNWKKIQKQVKSRTINAVCSHYHRLLK